MRGNRTLWLFALTLILAVVVVSSPALAQRRTALLIGNSSYSSSPLRNPVNDATDMAAKLQKLGFDVLLKTNVGRKEMEEAIMRFGRELRQGGIGLFYFAGHGMQVEGRNYLIPVDARIETESDVRFESVDAGRVLGKMDDAGNDMNIVILDACRDNPFARSFRSAAQGLARMDAPKGSIIAYATAPGAVAADGQDRNGIYTHHLLAHIETPGLSIEKFFKNVRIGVIGETQDKQVPWESSSLTGDFFFFPGANQAGPVKSPASAAAKAKPSPGALPAAGADAGPDPAPSRQGQRDARLRSARGPEVTNALGMTFVFVAPGSFMMGEPGSQSGQDTDARRHRVTLTRGFFLQTTEVTHRQWEAVMGHLPAVFSGCGDDCPVEMVSWSDVQAFIERLNRLEGEGRYRLPFEAEWEYACGAGTGRPLDESRLRRIAWYGRNAQGHPRPVAGRVPNAWGFYDMLGNVFEWCQDRFGPYESASVVDPRGASGGRFRVFRGGAWASSADACQVSTRQCHREDYRGNHLGFRLVRNP